MTLVHGGRTCSVCSAPSATCGHQPAAAVGGIVLPEENLMTGPATKTYDVEVNGFRTQMQLNDTDAERMGVKRPSRDAQPSADEKVAEPPANKARTVSSKSADGQ